MNRILKAFSICLISGSLLAQEPSVPFEDIPQTSKFDTKVYLLVNPFIMRDHIFPGVSLSIRRDFMTYDVSVHSALIYNSVSCTVSPTWYFTSSESGPYLSAGLGPVFVFGYLFEPAAAFGIAAPVRIGVRYEKFLGDFGVSIFSNGKGWLFVPIPEVRFGFGF